VIVSGNVETEDSFNVINRNAFHTEDSVNGAPKLNSANIKQLQYNKQHSKARKPVEDSGMPSQLPNLQKQARGPKKFHETDMNVNSHYLRIVPSWELWIFQRD
jgi:hypothetical protein